MAKRIVGIDIGYDTLKLALIQGKTVRKTATASMPKRLLREGRIVSPEAMAELIRNTCRENGIRCSQAAMSFSSEAVFVRNVTVPRMTADQLSYNLPYEFRDYITDELKNYVFDYAMLSTPEAEKKEKKAKREKGAAKKQPKAKKSKNALEAFETQQTETAQAGPAAQQEGGEEGSEERTMELLAAAAPVTLVEESRDILRKAGMKLVKAAPAVCGYIGLIRSMDDAKRPESGEYCILDLGYQAIRMYMFKGTRHEVTRALEFGLSRIDEALADAYNVDVHLSHTYLMTNYEDCQRKEVCVNAFNNIAVELMRALNFYRFSNPDSNLADVWVCGGGAAIEPLRQAIAEGLDGMTLHPADELIPGAGTVEQAYSMVEAIGIAEY